MTLHRASVYAADDGWHDVLLLPLMMLIWTARGAFPGRALRDEGSGDAPGAMGTAAASCLRERSGSASAGASFGPKG